MTSQGLKVGITAVFDPAITPHARTFMRALAAARNQMADLAGVEFVFADDEASAGRARAVARTFVAEGVDLVIGHFSSDAALAAMDIYSDADIALLSPAATADKITASSTVFRLCPADAGLVNSLLSLCAGREWYSLQLNCDGSAHGTAIAQGIRASASRYGLRLAEDPDEGDAVVFAGRLAPSASFLRQHVQTGSELPLILTDDAVSARLPGQAKLKAPVLAVGFRPAHSYPDAELICRQHQHHFGSLPETYFLESYAAFQILSALVRTHPGPRATKALSLGRFDTALGPVTFEKGEARGMGHAFWRLGPEGLTVMAEADIGRLPKARSRLRAPSHADQRKSS